MSTAFSTYGSTLCRLDDYRPDGTHPPRHLNGAAPTDAGRASAASPPSAGHNSSKAQQHSFGDNADELLRVGRLITSFRRIGLAIRDRRCERTHLIVLYAIMEKLNEKTGTAFPSRKAIAEREALGDKVVENAIYELRSWGYIDWERRAEPELHRATLLHYTLPVLTWTDEELTRAILAHRETLKSRSTPPTGYPAHGVRKYPAHGDP